MALTDGQPRYRRVLLKLSGEALAPGQAFQAPQPLFKKLDESVVASELARLEQGSGPAAAQ